MEIKSFLIKRVAFWCLILISMTISGSCLVKIDQEIEFHKPTLSLMKSSFETRSIKSCPTLVKAAVVRGRIETKTEFATGKGGVS